MKFLHARARKAFTLIELIITMAVTMVMLTMVISFSMMCNAWTMWGIDRYDVQLTQESTRTALYDFLSYYDTSDCYLDFDKSNQQYLSARDTDSGVLLSKLYYQEGAYHFRDTQGVEHSYSAQRVEKVYFAVKSSSTAQLVRVRLDYQVASTKRNTETETGTFVVGASTRACRRPTE